MIPVISAVSVLALVGMVCLVGYPTSMEKVKPGDVISFRYLQPHNEDAPRSFEKVVDKFRMTPSNIRHLNATSAYRKHDPNFVRKGNLVVTQDPKGDTRQYYAGRSILVRKHLFGRLLAS